MFKPLAKDIKTFIDDLNKVLRGEDTRIRVGNIPYIYKKLGLKNGIVRTNKEVIVKDTIEKHNVPLDVVDNLPILYSDPLIVMESRTKDNRLVAIVDAKDNSGNQIIVAISPNEKESGGYHFIPSFYGKDELEDFIKLNIKENRIKYIKDNSVSDTLQLRSQALSDVVLNNKVLQKSDIVNTQNEEIYKQNKLVNGFFDADLKTIVIGSNFNFGTLQHEVAHFYLDRLFSLYKSGAGNEKFKEDMAKLFSILNIGENQEKLSRDQQEQFASMSEAYLFNKGIFPEGAEPAMKMFFDWCPPQYNTIANVGYHNEKGEFVPALFNKESLEFFDAMYSEVPYMAEPNFAKSFENPVMTDGSQPKATQEEQEKRKKLIDSQIVEEPQIGFIITHPISLSQTLR